MTNIEDLENQIEEFEKNITEMNGIKDLLSKELELMKEYNILNKNFLEVEQNNFEKLTQEIINMEKESLTELTRQITLFSKTLKNEYDSFTYKNCTLNNEIKLQITENHIVIDNKIKDIQIQIEKNRTSNSENFKILKNTIKNSNNLTNKIIVGVGLVIVILLVCILIFK